MAPGDAYDLPQMLEFRPARTTAPVRFAIPKDVGRSRARRSTAHRTGQGAKSTLGLATACCCAAGRSSRPASRRGRSWRAKGVDVGSHQCTLCEAFGQRRYPACPAENARSSSRRRRCLGRAASAAPCWSWPPMTAIDTRHLSDGWAFPISSSNMVSVRNCWPIWAWTAKASSRPVDRLHDSFRSDQPERTVRHVAAGPVPRVDGSRVARTCCALRRCL